MAAIAGCFTEQTSMTTAPSFRLADMFSAISPNVDGGEARMTRSLPFTASDASISAMSMKPCLRCEASEISFGSHPTMVFYQIAFPAGAGDRTADQAESDNGNTVEKSAP